MPETINKVEIIKITPPILEKGLIWFTNNIKNIRTQSKNINSWWYSNYKEIIQSEELHVSQFLRLLDDWGYEKVSSVRNPGEFANRGGVVDIFPINLKNPVRIELEGNYVSLILILDSIEVRDTSTPLKNIIERKKIPKKNFQTIENRKNLEKLLPGSYVVHVDHGIAKLKEIKILQKEIIHDKDERYFILQYAKGDTLYVPFSVSEKISPYLGFGEPSLTRLGGNIWERTKRKVKEDLIETAKYLAKIYAKRELVNRPSYNFDEDLINNLKNSFKFTETDDQIKAIEDIKKDLASSKPMDRIICGDVGFGKTEVALRAAIYAIENGYQVALIAPTTILAHQHYKTFYSRFKEANIPVDVEKLTRIEDKKKQALVLKKLENKKCDIVIGTHRLLQKDVKFANLGLLVVDEEQRFGVKQKELFKEKRAQLDILSLSATPIPRTMNLALTGVRDLSTITTPPWERKPIETRVKRFNKKIIKKAIENELARKGQVYYLHNKIFSLGHTVEMLKELAPSAHIGFMHAKLPEKKLIETVDAFSKGTIDVLVSTTIMENGLDVTNANTLIVEDATRLGLAQSHQIRGRIGRSDKQAYAYFLYPAKKLKEKATQRLDALSSAQYLGAGYEISLKDLEIRGAGSFLGKEQSGSIAKVGFNLYLQLLNEAIEELKTQ